MSVSSVSDDSSIAIDDDDQLITAIQAGDMEHLDALLSQVDENGRRAAAVLPEDDDIHRALYYAAKAGNVAACRLLWGKLSRSGKQKYFDAVNHSVFAPLHAAARRGRLDVVRFLVQELRWNINQMNYYNMTPLYESVKNLSTARFLLENGANVNQGGLYGPLWEAVELNNPKVCRLLLIDYHADPNLNRRAPDKEDFNELPGPRCTDYAILNGNTELLRMLLEHGAFVGHVVYSRNSTSLNVLLRNRQKSREDRVAICQILIEHATGDQAAAKFLQETFEFTIKQQTTDNIAECLRILIDAGFDPRTAIYCAIRVQHLSTCQLLVDEYDVDPFLQQQEENNNDNDDGEQTIAAVSPFLSSARQSDTTLSAYFLGIWDERFSSTGGKNDDGDYPIHVVCCDPHVSLQAIQVLIARQAVVGCGEQGLLPFHIAANWGASLDVTFYLLQHCPDALSYVGNNATAAAVAATCVAHVQDHLDAHGRAKKKAKTTHSS